MHTEFQALVDNQTWELVPFTSDMKVISNKWIFKVKTNSDGSLDKLKARLVARGFEQFAGVDYLETFSPVVKPLPSDLFLLLQQPEGGLFSNLTLIMLS